MAALIASSAVRTCLGGGAPTFAALLRGECGVGPLRHGSPDRLNVEAGYHVGVDDPHQPFRAAYLLVRAVVEAVRAAGLDCAGNRVVALVGTGLGELAAVEHHALGRGAPVAEDERPDDPAQAFPVSRLHFGDAVRAALPDLHDVVTLSGACSASGYALALAQDMVELGECDAVVVAGTDVMTQSMLAMIGKVGEHRTDRVRPFDRDRNGVLLGEGAGAVVVVPSTWEGPRLARLAGSGLACDAHHPTAPDVDGIARSQHEAFRRADRDPSTVDLVVAHGTGTALNDPAECEALRKVVIAAGGDPVITGVKGAVGHTSGAAALVNVDVAIRCLTGGVVPPVVGLRTVLDEGAGLRFVLGEPLPHTPALVQVNAFGFGGVNAVILLEAV